MSIIVEGKSPVAIQVSVSNKLHEKKIILFKRISSPKSLEELIDDYAKEINSRHFATALFFYKYFLPILEKSFTGTLSVESSVDHIFLAEITIGHIKGLSILDKHDEDPDLIVKIREAFTKDELKELCNEIIRIINQLPKQCEECLVWMKEFPGHEKSQIDAAGKMVKLMMSGQTDGKMFEKARKEMLEEGIHRHGEYSLIKVQALEKIGILPKPKEMIVTINRIMDYLDIIHYGGCFNASEAPATPYFVYVGQSPY